MKFLIVSLRYLGDCLLAAALAPALKARFPDAQIDMLTFKDNAPILEGIQDISHVIGVEHHPNKFVQACSHLASWNKYDWALITMNSTRTVLYGYFAAKHQVMVRPYPSLEELWKRILITDQIDFVGGQILERTQPLLGPFFKGTAPQLCPIHPDRELSTDLQAKLHMLGSYVVCQCNSRYQDKNWGIEKWIELAHLLMTAGYGICFTGGPGDVDYLLKITEAFLPKKPSLRRVMPVLDRPRESSWGQPPILALIQQPLILLQLRAYLVCVFMAQRLSMHGVQRLNAANQHLIPMI